MRSDSSTMIRATTRARQASPLQAVDNPGVAGFDLDGVFDDDDYLYFYFNDEERDDASSETEASQVAGLLGLQPDMRVLDAGCGHGRITERLAQRGCRMVGIDRAPHFISLARRNAQ